MTALPYVRVQYPAGFGTFLRTIRGYTPRGSAVDQANIQALCTAMAGVGEVRIGPGSASFTSAVDLSLCNNLVVSHHPNTWLLNNITYTPGGVFDAIYKCSKGATGAAGICSAAVAKGALTFSSSISLPAGTIFTIRRAAPYENNEHYFISRGVTGAGPYTVTLDRPSPVPFLITTSTVQIYASIASNILLQGNGARVSSGGGATVKGSRHFEIAYARDVWIDDFELNADYGSVGSDGILVSHDIGCVRGGQRNLRARYDGSATGVAAAFLVETGEGVVQENLWVDGHNKLGGGIEFYNCVNCEQKQVTANNCYNYGLLWISNSLGNMGCKADGVVCVGNGLGAVVSAGDDSCVISNIAVSKSASSALTTDGTPGFGLKVASPLGRMTIHNLTSIANVQNVTIAATSLPTAGTGTWRLSECTTTRDLDVDTASLSIQRLVIANAATSTSVRSFTSGTLTINDLEFTGTANVTGIWAGTGTTVNINRGNISGGGSNAVYAEGTANLRDMTYSGYTNAVNVPASGTCNLAGRQTFTSGALLLNATGTLGAEPQSGRLSLAMANTNQTLTPAQYLKAIIEPTGALTAKRDVILPHVQGLIWTLKPTTTGGFGVRAIGTSGTGVDVADNATGRVYFNGTNFVSA